jgi:hypothetical protein
MDAVEAWVWDCLTGWKALEQFAEQEKQFIRARARKDVDEAMKVRLG